MRRSALGKSLIRIQEETKESFNFTLASKFHGPETSMIAEEEMTASGKREKHCKLILSAMRELKATEKRPVTGAQIANSAGMLNVEVMRRLATDLEYNELIARTDKMHCQLTKKYLLGWYLTN